MLIFRGGIYLAQLKPNPTFIIKQISIGIKRTMVTESISKLDYRNKIVLAPMVRVGTLPMRLLALRYGADIVYTEELIDWKLLKTTRRINNVLGTVDFVDDTDGMVVFRTCDTEKERVVLQIGTSSPERAVQVARLVEQDVAAIDVNMGCPKEFSIKGGMGASLLTNPENATNILKALVSNAKIPITCKMRILSDADKTVELAKRFESIGIAALGVHGRTKAERPQHPVHTDVIRKIAENVKIPVIGSGGSKDIEKHADIYKFKELCGTTSVMIARAAQWNVSIFKKDSPLQPLDKIIKEYLTLCVDYDNTANNSKYCVQMMLRELQETPKGKQFLECQTLEDICDLWDLGEYCHQKQLEYKEKGLQGRREVVPGSILNDENEPSAKRLKLADDVIERNIAFFRAHYADTKDLPKSLLHTYANKNGKSLPTYETQQEDRLFQTIVSFDGKKYASSYWEKNKRFAEQGAALVCILELGLINESTLIENGSILK